jgi:hypothetical protein
MRRYCSTFYIEFHADYAYHQASAASNADLSPNFDG